MITAAALVALRKGLPAASVFNPIVSYVIIPSRFRKNRYIIKPMAISFHWNEWNETKLEKHGVAKWEAEHVVLNARHPYPHRSRNETWRVVGGGQGGRALEFAYVEDEGDRERLYIIHAIPLTTRRRRG